MATEMVEYRPGRWVKVVDGQIVGRATPEEVAAWQRAGGRHPGAAPSNLDLDVDLSARPAPGPARALDVPLRPAYERRGPRPAAERPLPHSPEADLDAPGPHPPEPAQAAQPPARRTPRPQPVAAEAAGGAAAPPPPRPAPRPPAAPEERPTPVARERPAARPAEAQPAPTAAGRGKARAPAVRSPSRRGASDDGERATAATVAAQPTPGRAAAGEADGAIVPARTRKAVPGGPAPTEAEGRAAAGRRAVRTGRVAAHPAVKEVEQAPATEAGPAEADQGPRFWWIWNVHGQPVAAFLREWVPRYKEKFGRDANTILCHADDLEAVEACGYRAEVSALLQPGHFYLGHEDAG